MYHMKCVRLTTKNAGVSVTTEIVDDGGMTVDVIVFEAADEADVMAKARELLTNWIASRLVVELRDKLVNQTIASV